MLAHDAPWWAGEFGNLPHNANDNRQHGTGANADNFGQPPNTTATTGRNIPPQKTPQYYTGRLPEPGYGPYRPPAPQTPPGGWMYNKQNPTPAFNPVLPTPKPAPPRPGQAQSAPPSASQYRAGGWPDSPAPNATPMPTANPIGYFPEDPRRPGPPSVSSFGPGSKPVPSPTRDGLAQYDPTGSSNRQAWMAAGRPGFNTGNAYSANITTAADGTKFGNGGESVAYNNWRASGGQTSAPAPQQFGPPQAAQPPQGRAPVPSFGPAPGDPYGTMYAMDFGNSSMRTAERYTRPEGYVPNSTLWAQHAPTPEPEQAPYNPNPPKAPKPNVFPEMQRGPSASYLASPGYSTQATWDQSKGKMGQASYSGAMTMNANMANPGGESMRPPSFTFTAKGVDGKQYANPADAMARRDALIHNLGQQQARYSGSMGRNLGAPRFNTPTG